jgi:hypothetical protein
MADLDKKSDPAFHRYYARVMITEAKKRRAAGNQTAMVAILVSWARNGRRRYWDAVKASRTDPAQKDLFA